MDDLSSAKHALIGQLRDLHALLLPLSPAQLDVLTAVPNWTVRVLLADLILHLRALLSTMRHLRECGSEAGYQGLIPRHDHLSIWRVPFMAMSTQLAEWARRRAANRVPDQPVQALQQAVDDLATVLTNLPSSHGVKSLDGVMAIAESLKVDTIRFGLQSLDIALALGQPPHLHPEARALLVATCEALLSHARPAALTDDMTFILAASGRSGVMDDTIAAFRLPQALLD